MTQSLFIKGNKSSSYLMNTVSYEVWYGRYVLGGNSNLVLCVSYNMADERICES
jgi:hypothetical protein